MPLEPRDILPYLPAPPAPAGAAKWEITRSSARSNFTDWLTSSALREYRFVPPPDPQKPGAAPEPPQTTRIVITDTGYWPSYRTYFQGFTPGKSGDAEKFYLGEFPALQVFSPAPLEETTPGTSAKPRLRGRFLVLVKNRFLVEIVTTNQERKALSEWVARVNISKLNSVPDTSTSKVPNPVPIVKIDELNPKNSRSYPLYWSQAKDE